MGRLPVSDLEVVWIGADESIEAGAVLAPTCELIGPASHHINSRVMRRTVFWIFVKNFTI
jgi:hypothetical protein